MSLWGLEKAKWLENETTTELCDMAEFQYMDSRDSLKFHQINASGDFMVTLPIEWMMGVCANLEMHDHALSPYQLYVCCDIIEDNCARNTTLPILRTRDITTEQLYVQNTHFFSRKFQKSYFNQFSKLELCSTFLDFYKWCFSHVLGIYDTVFDNISKEFLCFLTHDVWGKS